MTVAQRLSADRMIAAKGQTVTLTRRTAGAYNTATASAAVTETTQTGKGVILPLAGYRKADGKTIVNGDETLLLSGLASDGTALAPSVDDKLTCVSGTYLVTVVDPLRPAGLAIIWDCVGRLSQ